MSLGEFYSIAVVVFAVVGWVRAKRKLIRCEYERDMWKIGKEPNP